MRVTIATDPGGPTRPNEDWAGARAGVAVVLDGLSEAPETGCIHGTPWYVDRLGTYLLDLASAPACALGQALAEAISRVSAEHAATCDLSHPGTPCSTVAMVREHGELVDYLVLSDSVVVLQQPGEPLVVTDRSVENFVAEKASLAARHAGSADRSALYDLIREQQRIRNQPGGYWVAQVDPGAARHARIGSVRTRRAVLLSDGAALPAMTFGVMTWQELIDLVATDGPERLVTVTRELEESDPDGVRWPRYKFRDDATAVSCLFPS